MAETKWCVLPSARCNTPCTILEARKSGEEWCFVFASVHSSIHPGGYKISRNVTGDKFQNEIRHPSASLWSPWLKFRYRQAQSEKQITKRSYSTSRFCRHSMGVHSVYESTEYRSLFISCLRVCKTNSVQCSDNNVSGLCHLTKITPSDSCCMAALLLSRLP